MAAYSNFRSSTQIEVEREELRAARQVVLDKAKRDYEKTERRKEKARLAGEGTWMLQSVTDRIDEEQKAGTLFCLYKTKTVKPPTDIDEEQKAGTLFCLYKTKTVKAPTDNLESVQDKAMFL
ncbi:hypothetical protein V1264_017605 [Littorina saxatilis]|uniref:Uncharacterized protein n=1 Tax=Littorina saxatilis TaxID=31220 RepID=A0AAN9GFX6_9CAEN